jgi:hypothetical protein
MSGLVLPQQIGGSATGWALVDYLPEVTLRSAKVAVGETAAIAYGDQLAGDVLWLIDHAVSSCTSATATSLRMYSGSPGGLLIDGTDDGNFQVADWPNGLQVAPGRQLCAVWSNADVGSVGTLALQVRVLRRVS